MINGDDLLGLLIIVGLGYIFYKKLIEDTDVLAKIKDGFGKTFHRDRKVFGRFRP